MIQRNLSKQRFILILSVAIFLLLVLVVQFIVLSVYRSKAIDLQEKLDTMEKQQEQSQNTQNNSALSGYIDIEKVLENF